VVIPGRRLGPDRDPGVSGAPPYRAMGGCVVTDHGVLAHANARKLSGFYALEAASPEAGGRWRRLAA
jgi:hypothetical protein